MNKKLKLIEKIYVPGSSGYLVTLVDPDSGRFYQGWGLMDDSTLSEVWDHQYAVCIFKNKKNYNLNKRIVE